MKRIGVIGRCQAVGIGDALLHMLDDCEVSTFMIQDIYRKDMLPHAEKALSKCDIVFSHYLYDLEGSISTNTLRKEVETLVLIPPMIFSGFHPDSVDLVWNGKVYTSPMGGYHSVIIAAAYSLDIPSGRVPALFNKFVYGRLGYFEEFAKARTYLDRSMQAYGLDITGEWPDWVSSGNFMHTFNHPKACVLASLAKLLAVRAGLVPAQTPTPEMGFDFLSMYAIWPLYPELAERMGLKGNYIFKKDGTPHFIKGEHCLMSLREFVEGSYQMYADVPAAAFDSEPLAKARSILSELLLT